MKIGLAQINPTVGDLRGNFEKILGAYQRLANSGAELVLAPELATTGYPPQDLVFKSRFVPQNLESIARLRSCIGEVPLLVGYVDHNDGRGKPFFNAAALLERGQPIRKTFKTLLPTYDVFDEDRYFEPGNGGEIFAIAGRRIGVTICEDIWTQAYLPRPLYELEVTRALVEKGAEIIVNLSASPFGLGKQATRRQMLAALAREHQCPLIYCNAVGGNDQLVFDGGSIAFNRHGDLIAQLPFFESAEAIVETDSSAALSIEVPETMAELYGALSLGVRDYLAKCKFKSAVLGLSGGVDSAVVAAIAAESLGKDNVVGVSMPSPYSSRGSVDDALALARNLGIRC
ncbi:MAG TPA: nitrilase-related carbon-nitrogen hydrolase, partial [Chthoniobacterales bacterium]|nr:nitrilase-related carbon-nitrogen hydrolase [Chthoniobacterales bacterium]